MWPSYMRNITPPLQCLEQFGKLYGKKMPVRIGGTTQDRATYDPDFDGYVSYHVEDPLDAPMELTFGPKYFDLIGKFWSLGLVWLTRIPSLTYHLFFYTAELGAETTVGKSIEILSYNVFPTAYSVVSRIQQRPQQSNKCFRCCPRAEEARSSLHRGH